MRGEVFTEIRLMENLPPTFTLAELLFGVTSIGLATAKRE